MPSPSRSRRPCPADPTRFGAALPTHPLRAIPSDAASRSSQSRSHLLGQHLPGDTALEHEQDAAESCSVVDAGSATLGLGWLFGQQRLDHFPKFVCNEFFSHALTLPATW